MDSVISPGTALLAVAEQVCGETATSPSFWTLPNGGLVCVYNYNWPDSGWVKFVSFLEVEHLNNYIRRWRIWK